MPVKAIHKSQNPLKRMLPWLETAIKHMDVITESMTIDQHGIPCSTLLNSKIDEHLAEIQKALFRARGELLGYDRPRINER